MNKKQLQKAIAIVKKDANEQNVYCDPATGKTCVLGGLALYTKFPKRALVELDDQLMTGDGKSRRLSQWINKHFGLNADQQRMLQMINDEEPHTNARRFRLIAQLRSMEGY